MQPVPWQVAYGHWIGWTAAAVLVAVGAVLLWLWLRWVARRHGRVSLDALGAGTTEVIDGPVVLRGRIEVPGAPVPALDGSGAAAACTVEASSETLRFAPHRSGARKCFRAPSLNIVTPDGEAVIRGETRVTHGSRETFPGRLTNLDEDDRQRLTSPSDEVVSFGAASWPRDLRVAGIIRTLRHGDEVVAKGRVRRNLGDVGPGASYRPMETAFELVALEEGGAVELAATSPSVVGFGKNALLLRALAAGVVISLAVGVVVGGSARRVDDFATAALFPPHRAWAIDELALQAASGAPGEQRLATMLAYDEVQADCRRTGDVLFQHGRWERAGDTLSACQDDASKRRAVTAYRLAGSLEKACRVIGALDGVPADDDEVMIMLLGGCDDGAGKMLRSLAEKAPAGEPRKQTLACLADGIDARAGDESARKRLATQTSEACRLVYADLLEGNERQAALAFLTHAPASEAEHYRHGWLRGVLAASVDAEVGEVALPPLPTVTVLLADPARAWGGRAHALEHDTFKALALIKNPTPDQRAVRTVLAIRAAAFETFAGNREDANRMLDVADADLAASSGALARTGTSAPPWVAIERVRAQILTLRTLGLVVDGDLERASSLLAPFRDLRPSLFLDDHPPQDTLPGALGVVRRDVVRPVDDALALVAAAQGKGPGGEAVALDSVLGLLVASTQPHSLDVTPDTSALSAVRERPDLGPALLCVAGSRVQRSPEILDWLRYESAEQGDTHPLATMWRATLSARAARLLGDDALAERREATAQAYRNALLQRHTALLFALSPTQ